MGGRDSPYSVPAPSCLSRRSCLLFLAAFAGLNSPTDSFCGTEIAVQPVERLADQIRPRNVVAGVVDDAALLRVRYAEQAEHRQLRRGHRIEKVEPAVQEQ